MSGFHILLVDDDDSVRESAAAFLRAEGYTVQTARDGQEAIETMKAGTDLIIADLVMPRVNGRELLRWVGQSHPSTAVIFMTGYGTIPQAVAAVQAGAVTYLTKPVDAEKLLIEVKVALQDKCLRHELARLRAQSRAEWHYQHIIGQSLAMKRVFDMIERTAPVRATVLVIGESGTGKGMVAHALHKAGPRRNGPFLAFQCGATSEDLIEATLFGHEHGSCRTRGYFQDTDAGTLLLDEIEKLPLWLQSKVLQAMEDGMITPVGTTKPQKLDVRIVASTNRDLEAEVKAGRLRQDLYFHLSVVTVRLPRLRERREDLPLLTRHFVDEICKQNGFEPCEIDPSLLAAFEGYDWPGNVRELRNTLESILVLGGSPRLSADDLPQKFFRHDDDAAKDAVNDGQPPAVLNLETLSKQAILKALDACHGNRTHAAGRLGISRRTLHRRLNEFGLRDG